MAAARVGSFGMRHHVDARREFWGDIFCLTEGDINVVRPKNGVFIGWHRHQHQDDQIFLVSGILSVRTFRTSPQTDGIGRILSERPPLFFDADASPERLIMRIPRNIWHGYEAMTDNTCILQFNGPGKWDGTDEERLDPAEMPWLS